VSESVHKCTAKGRYSIGFFQIFFKIPPGIANIFDHCIIRWGRMNPHSSMPPSLLLSYTDTQTHRYHSAMPANLHRKTPLWVIHRLTIQIPTYVSLLPFLCALRNG